MQSILSRTAAFSTIMALAVCGGAYAQVGLAASGGTDVGVSYIAERSLRAGSAENFWMQGASAEAGRTMWHGLGPAMNLTGAATTSIASSGLPLSLVTLTAGPRLSLQARGRISVYGEMLFGFAHGFNSSFPHPGASTSSATSFALQAGGGVDVRMTEHSFVRALDLGYLRTRLPNSTNGIQNTLRIGAGLGYHF